ncbi:MAG: bifunctional histidinol-phosphatase/imidazoleglycerol-phosphate dehydratase HisB [Woeseiaceae bacterium]|nr:bifunctional histidinol-phosphatase/imidazoleglycerol-phosphate dehydratase HisB [Woeseiaceae bacterium]
MTERILFIDRDGTLIREPADHQVDTLDKVALVPGVIPALLRLRDSGFRFVIVSNQDGLGTDAFPQQAFDICQNFMLDLLRSQGVEFDEIFVCPHVAADNCNCRKPRTGLLTRFLATHSIDLDRSAVIGDRQTDLELAANLGVRGFLIDEAKGHEYSWAGIAERMCQGGRSATHTRNTRETRISATVGLDSDGPADVATGIGFFDHMLEQIAKHGGFRLQLRCDGDLHIDEHHTVEDTAICLGTALREALGEKRGIGRYGFLLPMDESEAQVSIDLSGRGAFVFNGEFRRDQVGGLSTEMVRHFFATFADSLGAAIHISVTGDNTHHMVEACFKGVGRALRPALLKLDTQLPSTKGVLS